jgi:type IV secretion system protein TrbB
MMLQRRQLCRTVSIVRRHIMRHEALALSSDTTQRRGIALLHGAFGPAVQAALDDPAITEILLNPDGILWLERQDAPLHMTAHRIDPAQAERIIRLVATHVGQEAGRAHPIVSAELPGRGAAMGGARFEGLLPPIVMAPCFVIRKAARALWTLEDYVCSGVLTELQAELLRAATVLKRNILIIGGTASGKTTLANALLAEIGQGHDRLVILEDTRELQTDSANVVQLKSSESVDLRALVKSTLRLRPDRIVIGEVRGAESLDLLKAWNTGHSGGIATCHANDARGALLRLEQLCLEAIAIAPRALIATAVQILVVIAGKGADRRVTDICEVAGLNMAGEYELRSLLPEAKTSSEVSKQYKLVST